MHDGLYEIPLLLLALILGPVAELADASVSNTEAFGHCGFESHRDH